MRGPTIAESLQEYGRGLAGGLMFSLPLLYTMEMWWAGFIAAPLRLAGLLAFTYVLLLGYNRFAGMHRDATWPEVVIDSVEELGLGLLTSAGVLYLLQRIGPGIPASEALGKIVVEASVVAIGFSVGTAQLHAGGEEEKKNEDEGSGFAAELVIAFCGAVLFAANVAPTEEILMIAVEAGAFRLLGLCVASLVIGGIVLYFSNFRRSRRVEGWLDVIRGTTATYAVALIASAIILWFFGRFTGVAPEIAIRQVVVLAFPATIGASAGRLLLST
ncbi:MAG TPA: TIGR02587 family membrane protein [Thermoanaerobaculia bacterium]|nr:TIGR02587 family membrane protein [Thermoanaerobaculia bacterium]